MHGNVVHCINKKQAIGRLHPKMKKLELKGLKVRDFNPKTIPLLLN